MRHGEGGLATRGGWHALFFFLVLLLRDVFNGVEEAAWEGGRGFCGEMGC